MKKSRISIAHGFSLLELLVTLGLAAVLMTVVYQIWLQHQERRIRMDEEAVLQENGRAALHILRQFIQKAGYIDWYALTTPASDPTPQTLIATMQDNGLSALQALYGPAEHSVQHFSNGDYGHFVASDMRQAIEVRYSENGIDCLGQSHTIRKDKPTAIQFFIKPSANVPNLYCHNTAKGTPQPLMEGVEELRFSFLDGTNWYAAPQQVERVRAVHVCLILTSPQHRSAGNAMLQPRRPTCALQNHNALLKPNDYAPDIARTSRDNKRWMRVESIVHLPNNLLLEAP